MPCEVPVARMIRASFVQAFDALIYQFDRCLHALRAQHLHDLAIDLVDAEWRIDGSYMVGSHRCR